MPGPGKRAGRLAETGLLGDRLVNRKSSVL
jgi:hypothetical protein